MRGPPSGLLRYMLKACVAQMYILLEKLRLNVENFLRAIDAIPPHRPCNKVLKPNFQSIISQSNKIAASFHLF